MARTYHQHLTYACILYTEESEVSFICLETR